MRGGMPGDVLVALANSGSLDSVADSLRDSATALGMTLLVDFARLFNPAESVPDDAWSGMRLPTPA